MFAMAVSSVSNARNRDGWRRPPLTSSPRSRSHVAHQVSRVVRVLVARESRYRAALPCRCTAPKLTVTLPSSLSVRCLFARSASPAVWPRSSVSCDPPLRRQSHKHAQQGHAQCTAHSGVCDCTLLRLRADVCLPLPSVCLRSRSPLCITVSTRLAHSIVSVCLCTPCPCALDTRWRPTIRCARTCRRNSRSAKQRTDRA